MAAETHNFSGSAAGRFGWCSVRAFCDDYGFSRNGVRRMVASGVLRARQTADGLEVERPMPEDVVTPFTAADQSPRLTPGMVAEILGVSPRYVALLADQGTLKCHYVGARRRYSVEQVFQYIAARHCTPLLRARDAMVAWATARIRSRMAVCKQVREPDEFDQQLAKLEVLPDRQRAEAYARLVLKEEKKLRRREARPACKSQN